MQNLGLRIAYPSIRRYLSYSGAMPSRKRAVEEHAEPVAKRRSTRQAAAAAASVAAQKEGRNSKSEVEPSTTEAARKSKPEISVSPSTTEAGARRRPSKTSPSKSAAKNGAKTTNGKLKQKQNTQQKILEDDEKKPRKDQLRASSEDPDVDSIPTVNPEAPRHDGEWYWLMKAEPETRYENGIDVKFSIDDLRARKKPEGWDGIRAYAARNNMRNMNAGDKAFFYHSNCKEPGIVGIMEIVKEFSEDTSARQPGTPYYDPQSTKENPRWNLVHVEFRKKFAVPITLKELRELGGSGGPLESMQMLKQSRLSVTRVSGREWETLCGIADDKAREAELKHETTKLTN